MHKINLKISKLNPTPLYHQLYEQLKNSIDVGDLKPGDQMPTEEELCENLKISRPVIRQAYNSLINLGMIERFQGKGTFVKKNLLDSKKIDIGFDNFEGDMKKINKKTSFKIIKSEIIVDVDINNKFKLDKSEKCFYIVKLKYANEEPTILVKCFLPLKYFPNIDKFNFDKYNIDTIKDEMYNYHSITSKKVLEAQIIEDMDAEYLKAEKKSAVHCLKLYEYNAVGELIYYDLSIFPADRNKFLIY